MKRGTGMTDAIDRQAAIDALADMHCKSDEDGYVWIIRSDAWARIDALPSAQPERKKGSWNVIQGDIVVCSKCGMLAPKSMTGCLLNRHLEPNRTNFCPNCGADMRSEGEQDE